jgi:hypothetical protein
MAFDVSGTDRDGQASIRDESRMMSVEPAPLFDFSLELFLQV